MKTIKVTLIISIALGLGLGLYSCAADGVGNVSQGNGTTQSGIASLSWVAPTTQVDGTPLTDLAGFKVYSGKTSHNYGTPIDVGNSTSYTLIGLMPGTYYFAVTAYDSKGMESSFSSETSKAVN